MLQEKTYKSSSAAYRAIRQYEQKNGKSDFIMEKIMNGVFKISVSGTTKPKLTPEEFVKETPNVAYEDATFRYFPDGVHGSGYYELKKGDRRRPNSLFLSVEQVQDDCK
jgi:hypothetical protein